MTKNSDHSLLLQKPLPELSWETLDRRDAEIWVMAILLIVVLGVGLLGFMFPTVFWDGNELAIKAPERAFLGFCVLLTLVLVYLIQKQAKVRRLRRELVEAQTALAVAEQEASIQCFQTLPSMNQFRDMLAMEYRRASSSGSHMAVVLFTAASASIERLGRMTRLLRSMLRQGEIIYRISDKAVGVILPGTKLSIGASFAAQVEALSGIPKGELQVRIAAYPEDVSSLTELERKLRRQDEVA